jgi:hypothetical protein
MLELGEAHGLKSATALSLRLAEFDDEDSVFCLQHLAQPAAPY